MAVRGRLRQGGFAHLGEAGLDIAPCHCDVPRRHALDGHESFFRRDAPRDHIMLPRWSRLERRM
jgi:hypothetical protein